ncbi:hypothetical protein SLE2022_184420 [Rubroshorea leprosula]
MKRKDFEYDFLSLSRKSRRLDGELLSVMEDDLGTKFPQVLEEQQLPTASIVRCNFPSSEERALVLCNPSGTPFLKFPRSQEFPIFVHSDLIPGLKDCLIWPGEVRKMGFQPAVDESSRGSNDHLAVIPWASTSLPSDPIDLEETDIEMMEMEESIIATNNNNNNNALQYGEKMELREGLQPWQQPQNLSAPITW